MALKERKFKNVKMTKRRENDNIDRRPISSRVTTKHHFCQNGEKFKGNTWGSDRTEKSGDSKAGREMQIGDWVCAEIFLGSGKRSNKKRRRKK